ncbi:hypothetical protein N7539_001422 [Penicillium diatomitis]|uniref:Uncharacterized protein n=1 Tax=Penicillium diatomitis TaxID=2819901 RepID=A0A9W9XGP8_9EURO|nr:uncharacterized protein N7539_001422 [Penicillium diatomitis]KAJ5492676.1 hypothetical protein N7539_001422 [Penicillium diatomitis]
MPGVQVASASATPSMDIPGPQRPKSHKTPSRKGIVVPQMDFSYSTPGSPESSSTVIATPAPPLTPPAAHQDDRVAQESIPQKTATPHVETTSSGFLTPRRPSKPPTPDVTPPRMGSTKRPTLHPLVHLSASSRAESFQTALESLSSDGDMDTPERSTAQLSSKKPTKREPSSKKRNKAPGDSAKSKFSKLTPPSASQPFSETDYETGFESFDGSWATPNQTGDLPTVRLDKETSPNTRTMSMRAVDAKTLDVQRLDESLAREQNLRDRIHSKGSLGESPSMERFREEIGWPSYDAGQSPLEDSESRRISGVSSTSTVEALIIDSPKRAPRSLRHTEKRSSLRSASSPVSRPERTSAASNVCPQPRLLHKAARITEHDRRSISSDVSFSAQTTAGLHQPPTTVIPVVVIPERRSSLKSGPSSFTSSKPSSQHSQRRPPLVSSGSLVDVPPHKPQTVSDSASARSRDMDSRSRPIGRPKIPPRSSSLSAPTSRNNSRATSLTSESLRSHTLAMDTGMQKQHDWLPVSPPRHNILGPNGRGKGLLEASKLPEIVLNNSTDDMAALRPPSLPYTQWSIPSSSPGPIEIREATAVSMFAHRNRSLLLVDQRLPVNQSAMSGLGRVASLGEYHPRTPENLVEDLPYMFVESPLKNPRPPPKPPVSRPLPPLPPTDEAPRVERPGLGRRWTSMRRTWTSRPRSDSFGALTRSLSMRSAKNRKAGIEMDSRLHPFWRPRGFWEDMPESPEKGQSGSHTPADANYIGNSLGIPRQRLIFEGSSVLDRRSPEMKRYFNGMTSTSHGSLVESGGILRTGTPLYKTRYVVLSQWRMRWRYLSVQAMRTRFRRMRQRREERKRAARRESLKQSIGGPLHVVSSAPHGSIQ